MIFIKQFFMRLVVQVREKANNNKNSKRKKQSGKPD